MKTLSEQATVFSTYVEVIPVDDAEFQAWASFLHVCGGDPEEELNVIWDAQFSPRMWR